MAAVLTVLNASLHPPGVAGLALHEHSFQVKARDEGEVLSIALVKPSCATGFFACIDTLPQETNKGAGHRGEFLK